VVFQSREDSQLVYPPLGGAAVSLDSDASIGESCRVFYNPNVAFSRPGGICLGSPFPSIPIFSFGPSSLIFLLDIFHSILADYCKEPLPSMGADILPANLSSLGSFFPYFSSSSQSGGLGTGGLSLGPEYFALRVLEKPIERSALVGGVSPTSLSKQREVVSPVRKKPKFVQKKRVPSVAVGDRVTMDNVTTYSERALVGHARGRHFSLGFLRKWAITNWGSKVSLPPEVSKLIKGWFVFLLSSKEAADTLLVGMWEMVGLPIVLRKWTPIFDAS
jgi:hypothetical protein